MRRQALAALHALLLTACAHPARQVELRASNPNGCYAIVFERPSFSGAGEVLNGPVRLALLNDVLVTNDRDWRKRIRSVRVGSSATLTVYVETAFTGRSQQYGPRTELSQLDPAVAGRIQSLEITCISLPQVP